jgi:alpha-L-fucosidase
MMRTTIALGLIIMAFVPSLRADENTSGKFEPSWQSFAQYQCPDWFRDAKFGIWAHWSPQCVPEQGDWYARKMYIPTEADYRYHVEHYGHPSKFGFKDIDNLWHAEHWDPDKLLALYKRAGAKYFVALANHHDNFDNWDSKYQPWNATKIGPKKNLIAGWEKAARDAGLRFGVSVHASHAWSWYEPAQGADEDGPLKGVPYDGKLTVVDGKGMWWEGLDPQELYAQNHTPGKKLVWDWDASQGSSVPDAAYIEKFYNRTTDLIDRYHPDLLYFDDYVLPFEKISDVGLRLAAHYYNANPQGVMNTKNLNEQQRRCLVWDVERGKADTLQPYPWQTDTCIGDWHYRRSIFERHRYKTPAMVVGMLVDIVSKNGNLLLSIPVRGDGSIDDDEVKFCEAMAKWTDVNGQAIFGTRPWTIYGEGPSTEPKPTTRSQQFSEGKEKPYTPQDIRFTAKGETLYAIALAWPEDGKLVIQSLASGSGKYEGEIGKVELLGASQLLKWERTPQGLSITLPSEKPCDYAYALRITRK